MKYMKGNKGKIYSHSTPDWVSAYMLESRKKTNLKVDSAVFSTKYENIAHIQ